MKTGLNLVANFYGDKALRNSAFDRTRAIVLEDVENNDAETICKMSPGFTPDFPSASSDTHQMMLDESNGSLRFQMRLYNNFGYTAILAPLSESLRVHIESQFPKRFLIYYETTGIREVPVWT